MEANTETSNGPKCREQATVEYSGIIRTSISYPFSQTRELVLKRVQKDCKTHRQCMTTRKQYFLHTVGQLSYEDMAFSIACMKPVQTQANPNHNTEREEEHGVSFPAEKLLVINGCWEREICFVLFLRILASCSSNILY